MKIASFYAARTVAAAALASLLLLGGCATVGPPNPRDPWEPMNRAVSKFNDGLDTMFLLPFATVYRQGVPPLVRTGVANFFNNLSDGWSFVNSLLQLKVYDAAENWARFSTNTFWGVGGIFDVASELNMERHKEDFGQTLGRWGVPAGPYLVLPFFGPSTLRDAVALPIDRKADPVSYVTGADVRNSLYVLRALDRRSNLIRVGQVLEEAALDKYSFTRDAHLQRRRAEVYDPDERTLLTPLLGPPPLPPEDAPAASPAGAASAPGQPAAPANR